MKAQGQTPVTAQGDQSAFFVLTVWEEKLDGGRVEWKGKLLHVESGRSLNFEDWPDLVDLISSALSADNKRPGQQATMGGYYE